jgi:hypothetical protein
MIDLRYIYIMKERGEWYYPRKIVKIGIATSPKYRRSRIDAGIKNKIIDIVEDRKVLFARSYEKFLHWLFSPWRYTRSSRHPDIGRTEWFNINFILYGVLRFMVLVPRLISISILIAIWELLT